MAVLTLPDGTTITFSPMEHVGQENFTTSGYVYCGRLAVQIPGKPEVSVPIGFTNNDLQRIMMRCLMPEFEVPADYSHCTPVEVRDRTIDTFNMRIAQALMSIDDSLEVRHDDPSPNPGSSSRPAGVVRIDQPKGQ